VPLTASRLGPGGKVRFLHLGYQCPFTLWYQEQAEGLAHLLGLVFEATDLTGDAVTAAPLGAYTPMQVVVPGHPPLGAPRSTADMAETLRTGVPEHSVEATALRPAASPGRPHVSRLGDDDWPEAVAAAVRICLGGAAAKGRLSAALAAKLAWLEDLAGPGDGFRRPKPVVVLDEAPANARAFVELIPASASQLPLPLRERDEMFLTCVHSRPATRESTEGAADARPWLLRSALEAAGARVWAVCGRNSPYPNGPWPLLAGAGFAIVAVLGELGLPGRGYDQSLLVVANPADSATLPAGLVLAQADNVATLPSGGRQGQRLAIHAPGGGPRQLRATAEIPPGHKVALVDLEPGTPVVKYGQPIGVASIAIRAGDHVHTHNLSSGRAGGGRLVSSTPKCDEMGRGHG